MDTKIGELLAQITGDQATASSAAAATASPSLPRRNQLPTKRKPDNDLRGDSLKTIRRVTPPQKPSQAPRPSSENPFAAQRPNSGNGSRPIVAASRDPKGVPPKPSKPIVAPSAPKAPPKRGSFAEILARGQRAQAVMGQVGKIQHKKVEKGATRTKEEAKPFSQAKRVANPAKGKTNAGYSGTAKPGTNTNGGASSNTVKKDTRDAASARPKGRAAQSRIDEEAAAKKVKKAALVNTGYSGTARAKPADAARKKETPRGGALLNAPIPRGSSKRSRYEDDYDEELDDFIEYDDEEDEGPRYGYASDASSDMEAGLEELDVEERRAEYIARKEDVEEERLEKSLKAAKEERKRKAMEQLRARRR